MRRICGLERVLSSTHPQGRLTQILDLHQTAELLGRSLSTVRHWTRKPPPNFPQVIRSGSKKYLRAAELERWALGQAAPVIEPQVATVPPPLPALKRGRGRPPKQPKEAVAGQGR